jgi:hypothetical protein
VRAERPAAATSPSSRRFWRAPAHEVVISAHPSVLSPRIAASAAGTGSRIASGRT